MLIDGINLSEGSSIVNATIASGSALPNTSPDPGELFYLTTGNIGLYVYNASTTSWVRITTTTGVSGSSPLTTKGDLYGFSTTNARVPVGTDGQVLTADSTQTLGIKWAASSGGASFAVGSTIQSPSAPTDGGTWLACNGAAVSQTTYSSLYSVLGHAAMQFNLTEAFDNVQTNVRGLAWTGTKWCLLIGGASVTQFVVYNGSGTSSPSSFANALTNMSIVSDGAAGGVAKLFAWSNGATAANYSSNEGATWTGTTLPVALHHVVWTGTYFVGFANGSTSVYRSTTGQSWSLAGTLPSMTPNTYHVAFDGTNIIVANMPINYGDVSAVALSSNSGVSWTSTSKPGYPGYMHAVNGSGRLISGAYGNLTVTTNSFSTITPVSNPGAGANSTSNSVVWNGFCYVMMDTYNSVYTSADGYHWYSCPLNYARASILTMCSFYFQSGSFYVSSTSASPTTGQIALYTSSSGHTAVMTPACTTSTQFCLPYMPGYYIKAA